MSSNSATTPTANVQSDDYDWGERRRQKQAAAREGNHDLIFIGDSITHRFERADGGMAVWRRHYARHRVLNLGYGWDCTQNVLWRLQQGEFAGQSPGLAVLNIGTNNLTGNGACRPNTVAEIVAGIAGICAFIRRASSDTQILVMSVFPRGRADAMINGRVGDLNAALSAWIAGCPHLLHLDIGARFLGDDGEVNARLLPDLCHPSEAGYAIWAEAIEPFVRRHVDERYSGKEFPLLCGLAGTAASGRSTGRAALDTQITHIISRGLDAVPGATFHHPVVASERLS